jgi:hypothetical protein
MGPTGVMTMACMQDESVSKTGSLGGVAREPQRELRKEQARLYKVAERPVVVMTPGNAGRAKGP